MRKDVDYQECENCGRITRYESDMPFCSQKCLLQYNRDSGDFDHDYRDPYEGYGREDTYVED